MSSGGLWREESEEGNQREYIIGDSKYTKWEMEQKLKMWLMRACEGKRPTTHTKPTAGGRGGETLREKDKIELVC